jgi:hypothetical protein
MALIWRVTSSSELRTGAWPEVIAFQVSSHVRSISA